MWLLSQTPGVERDDGDEDKHNGAVHIGRVRVACGRDIFQIPLSDDCGPDSMTIIFINVYLRIEAIATAELSQQRPRWTHTHTLYLSLSLLNNAHHLASSFADDDYQKQKQQQQHHHHPSRSQ